MDIVTVIFGILFVFGLVFIAAVVVVIIVIIVRNAKKASESGVDLTTLQTDLAVSAVKSDLLAPARTSSERLDELDELLAVGKITAVERDAARARILAEL